MTTQEKQTKGLGAFFHTVCLTFAATAGYFALAPWTGVAEGIVLIAFVAFGYAWPEIDFLFGRLGLEEAGAWLSLSGLIGTLAPLIVGFAKMARSASTDEQTILPVGLAMLSVAMVTTLVACVLNVFNRLYAHIKED